MGDSDGDGYHVAHVAHVALPASVASSDYGRNNCEHSKETG